MPVSHLSITGSYRRFGCDQGHATATHWTTYRSSRYVCGMSKTNPTGAHAMLGRRPGVHYCCPGHTPTTDRTGAAKRRGNRDARTEIDRELGELAEDADEAVWAAQAIADGFGYMTEPYGKSRHDMGQGYEETPYFGGLV